MFESVRPSFRPSVCLSACMLARPNVCSHMRVFINACATFLFSNFLLLTALFVLVVQLLMSSRGFSLLIRVVIYQNVHFDE